MERTDNHRRLGEALKDRRTQLGLTLENVSAKIQAHGQKISPQYLSNIETAYSRPGKEPATPPDDLLSALALALGIPLRELHAALGRVPPGSPAEQLVREHLAPYTAEGQISREQVESLAQELDDIARVRVERITGQYQSQSQTGGGKQSQRQKQGAA